MLRKFTMIAALLFIILVNAQEKNEVLFSIEDEKTYTNEFIRAYQKNKDIVISDNNKDFDDYFNLFLNFKLKLKQAHDIKLDTSSAYKSELAKYKKQLISPYLQSPSTTDSLVKQAYERTITEVKASHVLIRLQPQAKPKDTLTAFQKITNARSKIINGEPFAKVANEFSEDPSVKENNGDLGYFSAFSMVYTFENAAYTTKIGEVSKPFRTQFGYHIVKVIDKRSSQGELEVAHIMVKQNLEDSTNTKNKIFDIYNKLEQGDDFSKIATEHSDDLSSAKKGGVLPKFGIGRMIKPFENIAFKLENVGDYSEPFKTSYGWHILKLLKKHPVKSYNELHDKLESKIKNDSRALYIENVLALELSKKYVITENLDILSFFYEADAEKMESNEILITIENKTYTAKDFYSFFSKFRSKNTKELYIDFKNKKIIDYYKNNLEYTNEEFANTYQEYQDGLLLFELLQKNIWEKAEKDSIGLSQYFNLNKDKYTWKKRAKLTIASCTEKDKAELVKGYLKAGKSIEEIKELTNEGATIHVLLSNGTLEEGSSKLPNNYLLSLGVSDIYNNTENHYTIIKVDEITPPATKKLDETRGEVINDYQNYLEEKWVQNLNKTYTIKINKRNLKKLKRQLGEL